MPYNANDPRWNEYHVTPRYLAGTTFTGGPAIRPLLDVGWKMNHDELGNVYVNAPEQTIRLGYLPEGEDDALWKITASADPFAMPRWLVTYKDSAPTEIVAGFTTALAAAYTAGPDAYLNHRDGALATLDVGTPLAAAGWGHRFHDTEVSFHSPDDLAEVYLHRGLLDHAAEMQGTRERWLTLAGAPDDRWYATASSSTPHHLVTAMHAALTDPAPVLRYHHDLRRLPPQATATAVKPRVPTPLDVRRTLAATSRSTVLPSAVGVRPFVPAPRQPSTPQVRRPGQGR